MTKDRSNIWMLAAVMACALLAGCGGGEAAVATSGETAPPNTGSGGTGTATLSWSAPVENVDGSSVTNLAGYRIYHGTSPNNLNNMIQVSSPGITLYVVESLASGTHYFAISAYNTAGVESDRSAVSSKSIL